jgi:hypothetical protein
MGLTIHYSFQTELDAKRAKHLVAELRKKAFDLPFQEVSDLVELENEECAAEQSPQDDLHWLRVQATVMVVEQQYHLMVPPKRLFAFTTSPGSGCEDANFGLCVYPKTHPVLTPRRRLLRTGKKGWSWQSSCKTQYASNPNYGGLPNFLRCHLLVIKMLDAANKLGILHEVSDEGGYWEKRDAQALAREVGDWNCMIGAFAGQLKDLEGEALEAEIFNFPNFEHLEANGSEKIAKQNSNDSEQ